MERFRCLSPFFRKPQTAGPLALKSSLCGAASPRPSVWAGKTTGPFGPQEESGRGKADQGIRDPRCAATRRRPRRVHRRNAETCGTPHWRLRSARHCRAISRGEKKRPFCVDWVQLCMQFCIFSAIFAVKSWLFLRDLGAVEGSVLCRTACQGVLRGRLQKAICRAFGPPDRVLVGFSPRPSVWAGRSAGHFGPQDEAGRLIVKQGPPARCHATAAFSPWLASCPSFLRGETSSRCWCCRPVPRRKRRARPSRGRLVRGTHS